MQNLENKDKILKIFSRVHCFNKDQLPRYVDGRLTHVEKHLLEQHLVNCELCSDAVEILQKPKFKTQYQSMGTKVQHYIRKSTYIAPVYEAERYQRNIQIRERFLTYFWSTIAAALVIGFFYVVRQQAEKETSQTPFVKMEEVAIPEPDHKETFVAGFPGSVTAVGNTATTTTVPIKEDRAATNAMIIDSSRVETDPDIIADGTSDPDKFHYKTAMAYYHQGNLDEAIAQFTQLTADTVSRYRELAHYQLAMCFKYKRQKAKARHILKELVNINGRMKRRAQLALNKL
jgi:tetratricopeptide (TPR) repeat protein